MSEVVDVEFGRAAREARRAYARLAGLVDEQEQAFLRDPEKFFRHAAGELSRRDEFIRDLEDAIRPTVSNTTTGAAVRYEPIETVTVTKQDYEMLQALKERIRRGLPPF